MKLRSALWLPVFLSAMSLAQDKPEALKEAPIGLEVGTKIPEFSLRDQFGHAQSNISLKGSKGAVLVFFRSADW